MLITCSLTQGAVASIESDGISQSQLDSFCIEIRAQKEVDIARARSTLVVLEELQGMDQVSRRPYLDLLEGEILLEEMRELEGLAKLELARNKFEEIRNDSALLEVYNALTKYHISVAQYPEALTSAFNSIELSEDLEDPEGVANGLIQVSDVYWYYGKIEESVEYGQKAVHLLEPLGPSTVLAAAYNMLADSYSQLPDYEKALLFIDKAISTKNLLGATPIELASSINSRGNIYKLMDRLDDAIKDYSEVLQICESEQHNVGMRASLANLGHIHLMKEEYPEAISYKLRSLEIQERTGEVQQMVENLLHLSEAYAGMGQYAEAYKYQQKLDSAKSIEQEQALDRLSSELSVKYDTEKKEEAILGLNEKVRLQKLSTALVATLLLLSLIAVIVFVKFNKQLNVRNEEKEVLLKEIHHRVKNNLQILSSLLSLQSNHLVDSSAIDAITEGKNRVESMGMIHQRLYSEDDITSVDIRDYVSDLCRYLEDAFSASKKEIVIQDDIQFGNMDVDYAIPLGLIINELVTNAVKYAFPKQEKGQLSIHLKVEGQDLVLQVSDNGTGIELIDDKEISASFGSMLIATLARKLKGDIVVDLSTGYSTTISFKRFSKKK